MSFEPIDSVAAISTSDASRCVDAVSRPLTSAEAALVGALVNMLPPGAVARGQLAEARVEELPDGSMGSLRFLGHGSHAISRDAVTVQSVDEDGVPIEIALNLDEDGNLFELDIWKVDFSPLRRLPEPLQVHRV